MLRVCKPVRLHYVLATRKIRLIKLTGKGTESGQDNKRIECRLIVRKEPVKERQAGVLHRRKSTDDTGATVTP